MRCSSSTLEIVPTGGTALSRWCCDANAVQTTKFPIRAVWSASAITITFAANAIVRATVNAPSDTRSAALVRAAQVTISRGFSVLVADQDLSIVAEGFSGFAVHQILSVDTVLTAHIRVFPLRIPVQAETRWATKLVGFAIGAGAARSLGEGQVACDNPAEKRQSSCFVHDHLSNGTWSVILPQSGV